MRIHRERVLKALTVSTFLASSSDVVLIWSCDEKRVKVASGKPHVATLSVKYQSLSDQFVASI